MKLSVRDWVSSPLLEPYLFAQCPPSFVENVAIDPRCPPHRKEFMTHWFEQCGIQVVQSHCFGYAPEAFEVYPIW